MIFVATGTTGFDGLVKGMDHLALSLDEPVVMQIGNGRYVPRHAGYFRFVSSLDPYYERASLVVGHGGMGTCLEVLAHGKPFVALANPDRYDQHQQDIVRILAEKNHLIWCQGPAELPEAVERARNHEFKRYVSPDCHIHLVIVEFLRKNGRPRRDEGST